MTPSIVFDTPIQVFIVAKFEYKASASSTEIIKYYESPCVNISSTCAYKKHEVWIKFIVDCDLDFKPLGAIQYNLVTFSL